MAKPDTAKVSTEVKGVKYYLWSDGTVTYGVGHTYAGFRVTRPHTEKRLHETVIRQEIKKLKREL